MSAYENILAGLSEALDIAKGLRSARRDIISADPGYKFAPEHIGEICVDLKISESRIAKIIGVPESEISGWKSGVSEPDEGQRRKLALLRGDVIRTTKIK